MQLLREQSMANKDSLIEHFSDKSSLIGVIGLGYVGLPLLLRLSEAGFRAVGFDIDQSKIDALNAGESYIEHIKSDTIKKFSNDRFEATCDFARVSEVDGLLLCVPTPLNAYREPDLSYITGTLDAILPHLRPGQMISLESTTYPGTTEEEIVRRVEGRGLKVGEDIFVVYSPEREDPANPDFGLADIPKVLGGATAHCVEVGQALYGKIINQVVPVSSLKTAEMSKLLENIHRSVNIGLVNEMKVLCDRMDIDVFEVIRAASTKPFGFVPYYPGPGLGGHCIPIDPFYLTWKAREYGLHTRFIELAGEINNAMPQYVVNKISDALNNQSKSLKGSRILVLGVAYKKNVDDMRESPAVTIIATLQSKGATIAYSDPHVPVFPELRGHEPFDLRSIELTPENLASCDCAVITTDHDNVDYALIQQHAPLIVDTRGVYQGSHAKIVKA